MSTLFDITASSTRTFRRRCAIAALAIGAALVISGCFEVLKDSTFRLWCADDRLCEWQTEVGRIRKAPTWHRDDSGVEFVETPTAISQRVTSALPRCIEIMTIADVEASAQMTMGIDFNDDGTIDYEQPIAAVGFREVKTQVTAPTLYDRMRVVVTKKGGGRAILASLRMQASDSCAAPPVELRDQPLGTRCSETGDSVTCRSGICCNGLCAECCIPLGGPQPDPDAGDEAFDAGGVTETIRTCPGSATCTRRDENVTRIDFANWFGVPAQCSPGQGDRPAGAECLANDDCTSRQCDGARSEAVGDGNGQLEGCEAEFPDIGECKYFTRVRGGRCR